MKRDKETSSDGLRNSLPMRTKVNKISVTLSLAVLLTTLFLDRKYEESYTHRQEESVGPRPEVPTFKVDSAYLFIQQQVNFGPRVPNTAAHRACAAYLQTTLQRFGGKVQVQAFTTKAFNGKLLHLQNIIASFNTTCSKRILLAAHWDTRPFADKGVLHQDLPIDGANDGASGVGVLLEIARIISQIAPSTVGVDIIFFDGEDYGEPHGYSKSIANNTIFWCLGSQHWSKHKHQKNYTAAYGILLDMVGAADATFYREHYTMYYAPKIARKVWDKANQLGHGQYFIPQNSKGLIWDDHLFVNTDARIPMINIIDHAPGSDDFFPAYHHTHEDKLQLIDKKTLKAVGETLLYVIYEE